MDDVEDLRSAGLRVTAARLAILDAVRSGDHLDAEHIAGGVRSRLGRVSTQAVYDALRALTAAGLLRRIEPAGSPARYEVRVGDNHHHLVCRGCGEVTDIDCVVGRAPCLEPSDTHGYAIDEAEVVFWGVCPSCRNGAAATGPSGAAQGRRSPDRPQQSPA
jgi:Fe2+ or Zn2+ uptake regulation protein